MNLTKTSIALAAFLAGCGLSAVASHVVIPSARAGTNPTRWENLCLLHNGDWKGDWNRAGAEGWELVGEFNGVQGVCFKRQLP